MVVIILFCTCRCIRCIPRHNLRCPALHPLCTIYHQPINLVFLVIVHWKLLAFKMFTNLDNNNMRSNTTIVLNRVRPHTRHLTAGVLMNTIATTVHLTRSFQIPRVCNLASRLSIQQLMTLGFLHNSSMNSGQLAKSLCH